MNKMFFQKSFFKEFVITLLIIDILHFISLKYYLYWTIEWFDILMHFLGGFFVAIFVIFIIYNYSDFKLIKKQKIFLLGLIIGLTMAVGLTWELWEVFVGFTDTLKDVNDTIIDLIMDLIGAVFAIIYSHKKIW